ncbi:MAG: glycoside hydrolase family 99-like domain-containing protein [Clostridia bacterium]|nr:glycoside hydrolase family 99-like domain-containing protein [Clostridia bacterium]
MQNIDVAAYIWPAYTGDEPRSRIFWQEGIGEWQSVKNSKPKGDYFWDRKPLWGYVNEADPYVMEMQIEAALDHNVNVFIYDWYWYDDRPFLENCLNDGFLKAKNNQKMKFYLMWANHDANDTWDIRNSGTGTVIWQGAVTETQFKKIGERWLEKYFALPNYYCINERPLISIYDMQNFISGLGGLEKAKENMAWLNEEAKKRGFKGVHFQFVKWGTNSLNLSGVDSYVKEVTPALAEEMGFLSLTHYQFVHFLNVTKPYPTLLPDLEKEYDKIKSDFHIPYFPHVSIGWDNNPRYINFHGPVLPESNPENFEQALKLAKAYAEQNDVPMVTVNSWNEWTESSYLEPDDLNGYGYLEAIKRVFG